MQLIALDNVRKKFMDALNSIGIFLQTNSGQKNKKKHGKVTTTTYPMEREDEKIPQDELSFKGSGMGKGHINTDAAIFNQPRKDEPRGRQH